MSTLMVDDELYQRAADAAAAQGQTVDDFVGEVGVSIDCHPAIHLLAPRHSRASPA